MLIKVMSFTELTLDVISGAEALKTIASDSLEEAHGGKKTRKNSDKSINPFFF